MQRLHWKWSLQSVHKSRITRGFTTRSDGTRLVGHNRCRWVDCGPLVDCWFWFCPIIAFTILRGCWNLRFINISTGFFICVLRCPSFQKVAPVPAILASIFGAHGVGPRGALLTQHSGRLLVPRLCLNVNFFTNCKGFQLSSSLIIVVPLGGLFLLHFLSG